MELTNLEAGVILAIYFLTFAVPALLGAVLVECILPRLRSKKKPMARRICRNENHFEN